MPSIPHFRISIKMNNPNNMYCTVYQSTVNKVAPIPKKDRVVGVPIKKGQGSPVVGDLSSTHALPVLGRIMLDSYIIRGSLVRPSVHAETLLLRQRIPYYIFYSQFLIGNNKKSELI
jgi:hypothetical protein